MKTLRATSHSFALILLGVVLASCAGNIQSSPPAVATQPAAEHSMGGGGFFASYSGTVSSKSCGWKCTQQTFTGSGHASFLHKSTQAETLKIDCAVDGCAATGTATLTSDARPSNTMYIEFGSFQGEDDSGNWYALSGTGKFAHVSGSGYWHTSYGTGTYTQSLSGSIGF
jgi:hypothetical protein